MFVLFVAAANAVWITDYYPQEYEVGANIPIKANSMVSELHPNEPQDYYTLDFCAPKKDKIRAARRAENLGEILIGDKVLPTLYSVDMKVDRKRLLACNKTYGDAELQLFKDMIVKKYKVRWLLDSLPNLQPLNLKDRGGNHEVVLYEQGVDIGYVTSATDDSSTSDEKAVYLYTHVNIEIDFHGKRIVGFRTLPDEAQRLHNAANNSVQWSYSVKWRSSEQQWGSRWDVYGMNNDEGKSVYIFSTLSSLLFIFIAGMYLKRRLGKRILRNLGMDRSYMSIQQVSEEVYSVSVNSEEANTACSDGIDLDRDCVAAWTLLRDQIYFPPKAPELLCALVGAGVQMLVILFVTALLAMLGILYAAHRGLLLNCIIISFFLTSGVNSFVSAWLYKSLSLRRRDDVANFITSFFLFPLLLLIIIFPVNIMLQHRRASSSIYWSTLGIIIFGWLSISLFTSSMGYYLGKTRSVTHLRFGLFYRSVPNSAATAGPLPHLLRLVVGLASFAVLWIPLKFIYMSIWGTAFYQLYTLQWLSVVLWLFFTTELCIAYVFWQLNSENHRWWWCSYLTGASVGLPALIYSIVYYALNSDITSFASLVIYFGYTMVFSLIATLLSGSICFLASFFFIRRIYMLCKVD